MVTKRQTADDFMIRDIAVVLVVSLLLVSTIVVTGCVQDNGSNYDQQAVSLVTPSGTGAPGGSPHQYSGAAMLSNVTFLTSAANNLGVSEQDLENALANTKNSTTGRSNLTLAAQQLGVSRQQLMDAFGAAGGRMRNGSYNATQTQGQ
jgi:hypothetical protein